MSRGEQIGIGYSVKRALQKISAWRSARLDLRWRLVSVLTPRRSVHSRGLKLTLQCENRITHSRWEKFNIKEPETLDWIDTWMRSGDIFFDIGANIGVYTIYAALRHPEARVVAFEPEYSNLHLLRDNIIENDLQDRVEVYSVALSNHTGLSHLHIQDFAPGSALHTESKDMLSVTRYHQKVIWSEGISSFTLDTFCEQTGLTPNCIKIDVDGTEPEVLQGAMRTLRSPKLRSLIIELPADRAARTSCELLLDSAGLRCKWRHPVSANPNSVWLSRSA